MSRIPIPRAVLLDLDDTIVDDSGGSSGCWRDACSAHQEALDPIGADTLDDAIRRARRWYWADADRHLVGRLDLPAARAHVTHLALQELGRDDADLAESIASAYGALRTRDLRLLDGALETVVSLRERGCRLALVTNGAGAAQRLKIERFGLEPLFDAILIEGELGFGKPDPRVYRRALDSLEAEPRDAWMIGDNLDWDVAPPQRLGMAGIWIDRHGTGLPSDHAARPDRIVRSLSELRHDGD